MDLAAALLAIMLAWPAPADEPNVDRVAWLTTVAAAIEEAALEATCTHQGADHTCKPSWPGAADELATLLAVKAYRERSRRASAICRATRTAAIVAEVTLSAPPATRGAQRHRAPLARSSRA